MLEHYIQAVRTDDAGLEEPAATRERLRAAFPPGATRRMTQLGMLVGAALGPLEPTEDDAIVYASSYGESRTLETYLESFPFPSPTMFQTSIHPSGVQQALIGRQRSVRELWPISARENLAANALLTALLSPAGRVLLCGGEERGTWLLEKGVASDRTFAFAIALTRSRDAATLGRVALLPATGGDTLAFEAWFDLLQHHHPYAGTIAPGWRLELAWT